MTRVALHGGGRMAGAIVQAAAEEVSFDIFAVVSLDPPEWETDIPYLPELDQLSEAPEVLIDFSMPNGTVSAAEWCLKSGVALLSGVTGLHQEALDGLKNAARQVPVLWSPNMSVGVNLLAQLCAQAAAVLQKESTVLIEDVHHQWKIDAPSGTALMLGEVIGKSRGEGAGGIEYASVREGEAVGRHTVTFRMEGEEMVLCHDAHDRSIFARGAISAAKWLKAQPPGLYTARDWILHRR